jgi:hypothetical protein
MHRFTRRCGVVASALMIVCGAVTATAQGVSSDPSRGLETRAALMTEAQAAEAGHRTSEAFLLNSRLQHGDFQEGDRIVVSLQGTTPFMDTITVRTGKMLPLPRMTDLPLEGVLRSELNARLSSHLALFLRDPSARATPLLRVAVLGQVQRPGYYYTSADVLLSDVIMKAGGPGAQADLNNLVIRRAGETIWNARDTRTALDDGLSLDRLHLRAGDELTVGEEHHFNWTTVLTVVSALSGVALAVFSLSRR